MTPAELYRAKYLWEELWARENQLPPEGPWQIWLINAGRGYGKSRAGAEFVKSGMERGYKRIALVGRTAADVRDVMVKGESGLLACCPPWWKAKPMLSNRHIRFDADPYRDVTVSLYSAEEPDLLRGPQHDLAWADEVAAWQYDEAWDNLLLGLRLPPDPRVVATTTPKRRPLIRKLLDDPAVVKTFGSTYDNAANLAPTFLSHIVNRYEGTSLGRQELYAEFLSDVEGALWTHAMIEQHRVEAMPCEAVRIVVAVDPSTTGNAGTSAEAGIVVAALGQDEQVYILKDCSLVATPLQWATVAVKAYDEFDADRLIAETNNGGDMVELTVRMVNPKVSFKKVTATRGKATRAEPIAALYEQGRVHHVGCFPQLEDQMTTWTPGDTSPDRIDALVWAVTELAVQRDPTPNVRWL